MRGGLSGWSRGLSCRLVELTKKPSTITVEGRFGYSVDVTRTLWRQEPLRASSLFDPASARLGLRYGGPALLGKAPPFPRCEPVNVLNQVAKPPPFQVIAVDTKLRGIDDERSGAQSLA